MEDGNSDHRRVEGQGEETWVVELVLEQATLSETRGAAYEPRGVNSSRTRRFGV